MTPMADHNTRARGATTVEYAVIVVLVVAAVIVGAWLLVDPRPNQAMNSILPMTFDSVGRKVGHFGTVAD